MNIEEGSEMDGKREIPAKEDYYAEDITSNPGCLGLAIGHNDTGGTGFRVTPSAAQTIVSGLIDAVNNNLQETRQTYEAVCR